jgi:hypothetical protein
MGQSGVDVILSPAAQTIFPFLIECKNKETLNVTTTFLDHAKLCWERNLDGYALLVHSRNHSEVLVTLKWDAFVDIYRKLLEYQFPKDVGPN